MTSTLDISKINQAGEDLLSNVQKMYDSLQQIKTLVDGSKSFFDSPAGNDIRSKFNQSAEKFSAYKTFLNTYGEFLKTYSANVKTYEQAVQEAAGEIPVM